MCFCCGVCHWYFVGGKLTRSRDFQIKIELTHDSGKLYVVVCSFCYFPTINTPTTLSSYLTLALKMTLTLIMIMLNMQGHVAVIKNYEQVKAVLNKEIVLTLLNMEYLWSTYSPTTSQVSLHPHFLTGLSGKPAVWSLSTVLLDFFLCLKTSCYCFYFYSSILVSCIKRFICTVVREQKDCPRIPQYVRLQVGQG